MNETATLAEYVASSRADDIPAGVLAHSKLLLLDQIGCGLAGTRLPWCERVLAAVTTLTGDGPSRVLGSLRPTTADEATFMNAVYVHSNEIDDVHLGVRTHPGAVVIPAVHAMAQYAGVTSGRVLLHAQVIGYEVMLRVCDAAMPSLMDARHHHTPPAVGPFGAAAAAAVLLKLDAGSVAHALSIAASHSCGLMQYSQSGGSVKRLHPAIGAKSGVRAAVLAAHGVTGPAAAIEGSRGFLRAYADCDDASAITAGLGDRYLTSGVNLKRYSANYRIHAPIEALLAAMNDAALAPEEIASIRVAVTAATIASVGAIVEPHDALGAHFSLRFALAVAAFRGGKALNALTDEMLRDERIRTLARVVALEQRPETPGEERYDFGATVTVRSADGREICRAVAAPMGGTARPFTEEQTRAKFVELASPIAGPERASAIIDAVGHFDSGDASTGLWPALWPDLTG